MQFADTVRVVRSNRLTRVAFFASVLSVQPPNKDDDGTNGEPTITIGFLDPERKALVGGADWHKAFSRVTTVRHASHDEVQTGATEYCWTEVLRNDGGPVSLQPLNMTDLDEPADEAAPAPSTIGTVVYQNHNNVLEVYHKGENLFLAGTPNDPHQFSDLFSAKVYVDAQPPREPVVDMRTQAGILGVGVQETLNTAAVAAKAAAAEAQQLELKIVVEGDKFEVYVGDGVAADFNTLGEVQAYLESVLPADKAKAVLLSFTEEHIAKIAEQAEQSTQQEADKPVVEEPVVEQPVVESGKVEAVYEVVDRGEDLGDERFTVLKGGVQLQNFPTEEAANAFMGTLAPPTESGDVQSAKTE